MEKMSFFLWTCLASSAGHRLFLIFLFLFICFRFLIKNLKIGRRRNKLRNWRANFGDSKRGCHVPKSGDEMFLFTSSSSSLSYYITISIAIVE